MVVSREQAKINIRERNMAMNAVFRERIRALFRDPSMFQGAEKIDHGQNSPLKLAGRQYEKEK